MVKISQNAKINIKAFTLTAMTVMVFGFLLTMFVKYPSEVIVIAIFIALLAVIGYLIFQLFMSIRDVVVEHQEDKEAEERRRAKGY